MELQKDEVEFLECEKFWVFVMLMSVAGYLGAFTYSIRGGVFCNAQTANFVMFAMALGNFNLRKAEYYLLPMIAYLSGTMLSEILPFRIKRINLFRWETILVGFEMMVVLLLGLLPESAPYRISQIAINFICSMQYNTFRQAQKVPMATTFCTNHVRQFGVHLVKWSREKDKKSYFKRSMNHFIMILAFIIGAFVSTVLCNMFAGKAIWGAGFILFIIFAKLVYADLITEKELLDRKPAGH